MGTIQRGATVLHKGSTWRVLDVLTAVGGQEQASLECLEEDAFANVPTDQLELEPMTDEEVMKRIAQREKLTAPRRTRHRIRLRRRRLEEWRGKAELLTAAVAEAEERLAANDLQPLENRILVPGKVVRIEPAQLVRMANAALASLEARVRQTEEEQAADEQLLAELEGRA